MRKLLIICLVLIVNIINAQDQEYEKITFEYVIVPNLKFEENQLSGSTELLKREFPNQKIMSLPDDPTKGFILYEALSDEDKNAIVLLITHCSNKIYGEYDTTTKCTRYKTFADATIIPDNLKKLISIQRDIWLMETSRLDYTKEKFYRENNKFRPVSNLKGIYMKIEKDDQGKEYVIYNRKFSDRTYIEFSEDLPVFVTPIHFFKNAKMGLKTWSNLSSTGNLVTIKYQ